MAPIYREFFNTESLNERPPHIKLPLSFRMSSARPTLQNYPSDYRETWQDCYLGCEYVHYTLELRIVFIFSSQSVS